MSDKRNIKVSNVPLDDTKFGLEVIEIPLVGIGRLIESPKSTPETRTIHYFDPSKITFFLNGVEIKIKGWM